MVEKQASSEIAQSRERFENQINELCGQLNELRPGTGPGIRVLLKMAYEQAERDTRERCAHEARRWILRFVLRYENYNLVGYEIADALAEALRTDKWPESVWKNPFDLAKRIRGKE